MKMEEMEKRFDGTFRTILHFADGKDLIVYIESPFSIDQRYALERLTSEEFKRSLISSKKFTEHKVEDLPDDYGKDIK